MQHQDIDWSGSRYRFTGEQALGNGTKAGFRLEQQLQKNDGRSRVNRVRYDRPSFGGFSLAASSRQGGSIELAAKYKADLGLAIIDSRALFADAKDFAADAEFMGMSGSVLFNNGFNITAAYSDTSSGFTQLPWTTAWVRLAMQKQIRQALPMLQYPSVV